MTSRLVRAAVVVSLVALLSACNMTAQITTHLNGKGGGTLGLRVVLDKEVRDGLAGNGGRGINALEGLFNRLRAASWTVTRSEPAAGLDLQATKEFTGRQGFTDALRDLSGGSTTGSGGPLGGYSLDYTSHGSFFKTKTDFSGTVDTSEWVSILAAALFKGDRNAAQSLLNSASDNFHFEILATLPGSVSVGKGDGTVTNGEAIWRPALGSRVDISASASAIKTSSLLFVGVPALLLLAGFGWYAIGRRQKPLIAETPTPAHRRRERVARAPHPVEQLLAIIPDPQPAPPPTPVSLEESVIELDVPEAARPAEPTA